MSDPKCTLISNTLIHSSTEKCKVTHASPVLILLCICTRASPAFGMVNFLILPNLKEENMILLCTSWTTSEMKHEVITLLALSSFVKSLFKSFHICTVEAAAFFWFRGLFLKNITFSLSYIANSLGFFSSSLWFGVQIYTIFIIGMYLIFQSSMSIYFQFMISGAGVAL